LAIVHVYSPSCGFNFLSEFEAEFQPIGEHEDCRFFQHRVVISRRYVYFNSVAGQVAPVIDRINGVLRESIAGAEVFD
jgi:hypothetical protein